MTRIIERRKAIELRIKGKTYSQIMKVLQVSKSTLSDWLSSYPLNERQISILKQNIKKNKDIAIEKTIVTKFKKRQTRLKKTYEEEKRKLFPFTDKEFYLAGLFLYWGEGNKNLRSAVSLNNTDPRVVYFYYRWLIETLKIPKEKIRISLHLYQDMDIEKAINFWKNYLDIPVIQFIKPYIKESTRKNITQKGFGYGTCGLYINDQGLKEKIMLGIESLADKYCKKINKTTII